MTASTETWLSIVTPVFNEAGCVVELVRRIDAAARRTGVSYEIVVVDDGSTDATPGRLAALVRDPALGGRLRVVHPGGNVGQFRATRHGLAAARGSWVAVLDGDLQDPPEVLVDLVAAVRAAPGPDAPPEAVFAVKSSRQDPAWFLAGRAAFAVLQGCLSRRVPPPGAGSYCVLTAELARRVADVRLRNANLAPVVAALGARMTTVPYAKAARYDGRSRVGPAGLLREALGSLAVSGALLRLLLLTAALLAGTGGTLVLLADGALGLTVGVSALTASGLSAVGARGASLRVQAALPERETASSQA